MFSESSDLEERLSLADMRKIDSARVGDESLLLETTQVFPLSSKELHYLELNDANNIPFPYEIKQKIHEIVEGVTSTHHQISGLLHAHHELFRIF